MHINHSTISLIRNSIRVLLVILLVPLSGLTQTELPESPSPEPENPIYDYLVEIDNMGRTLSGWQGEQIELSSWFFASYAMLMLSNRGEKDNIPYSGLEELIPSFWGDLKHLKPRDLIEIAGGVLSYGKIMALTKQDDFSLKLPEEQLIIIVGGYSYLRMLNGTITDTLFADVIKDMMSMTTTPREIPTTLVNSVISNCGPVLGKQFEQALSQGSWMDVGIDKVKQDSDSVYIYVENFGAWSFPIEVLIIDQEGDSTYFRIPEDQLGPLTLQYLEIKKIVLDPRHILAEFYRFNNKWPRLKGNVRVQPIFALPDWESYRIVVSPSLWSDWDGDKRYALKFSSGFGIDLWPAYPSDFRHRITTELNVHKPLDADDAWGGRITYEHPLSLDRRLFMNGRIHYYDDWSGASYGLTKYIGKQRFLIHGSRLLYQRLSLSVEQDQYGDPLIWEDQQTIQIIRSSYTGLSLTRFGDRLYIKLSSAYGKGPEKVFTVTKTQVDLTGVFFNWLVGGLHIVSGSQSKSTPGPYRFSQHYAWQDNLAALPSFRGQSGIDEEPYNYVGLNLSAGYWMSWYQAKLFASSMLYDDDEMSLSLARPQYAAGFGFEHKSLFTLGLYFPVWQSHPTGGENPWAWRYQFRLSWNL